MHTLTRLDMDILAEQDQMNKSSRFWLAVFLAPLSVTIFFSIARLIPATGDLGAVGIWFATAYSYLGSIVLGLPYVLLLRAKGKLSLVALLLGGILGGVIFSGVFGLIFRLPGATVSFQSIGVCVFLSSMVAVVFGAVARVRLY